MGVSVSHVSVEDECEERKMVCGKVGLVGLVDTIAKGKSKEGCAIVMLDSVCKCVCACVCVCAFVFFLSIALTIGASRLLWRHRWTCLLPVILCRFLDFL